MGQVATCGSPRFGVNLVSFKDLGDKAGFVWREAVREIRRLGFCEVSVTPIRFVNLETGAIAPESAEAPRLADVASAVAEAKTAGLTVVVNPFVEPEGFAGWRGQYNPLPGSSAAVRFWSDYRGYLRAVAQMAEANGADALTIGSELRAITSEPGHAAELRALIDDVDAVFRGRLGYAANFDEFENETLTATVWEHRGIDFVGIDAYFPLATDAEADASGPYPDSGFITSVAARWTAIIDERVVPFARARKARTGMPVIFTEAGLIPYNRTTTQPWSDRFVHSEREDTDEQINGYRALVDVAGTRRDTLLAVHFWHWSIPGSRGSAWALGERAVGLLSQFVTRRGTRDRGGLFQVTYEPARGRAGL
jgi:hypothetical protein